jgi:sugar/nucleoside kinase (ribokinase family)
MKGTERIHLMSKGDTKSGVDVIVAGHMCVDIIPRLAHADFSFRPGALEQVGPATISLGGCVSNAGLTLKKLGASVRLVGRIGSDTLGELVQLELKKFGESGAGLTKSRDGSTSYSVILSPPSKDRMFLHYPGTNDSFSATDVVEAFASPAKVFHFGYPPLMRRMYENDGRELERILCLAKQKGLLTSLDMAYPDPDSAASRANWRDIAARVLPHVDIFLPSYEEMVCMFEPGLAQSWMGSGSNPLEHLNAEFLEHLSGIACQMGAAVVGVKLGDWGLYVRTNTSERLRCACPELSIGGWADRELWTPIFKANVVGTTGAGDATGAGFLYGILRGFPLEQVCRIACAVGACSVEAEDANSGVVPFESVLDRMTRGWEQQACKAQTWPEIATGVFAGTKDRREKERAG